MFHAARPPRPTAERAFPQLCGRRMDALPRPSPHPLPPRPSQHPLPPLPAGGTVVRVRGEAEAAGGRRQGGDDGAVAAGENDGAVSGSLVGDSAAVGVSGLVTPEERKRGLEFPARPSPKRRALSANRQFPPGSGRDAPPLTVAGGGDDGLRVGTAPSRGDFSMLEQAPGARPAGCGAREEGCLPLQIAPASAGLGVLEKVTAADDGGAPVSDGYHRGPEAAVVKSSDGAERVAGLVVKDRGRTRPMPRLLPERRMISAIRRFPPGCGRGAVVPLASRGGGQLGLPLEALLPDGGLGALEDGRPSNVGAMDTIEAVSKNALRVVVEVEELEDGEIPPEPDHVLQEFPVTHNNALHELTAGRLKCVAAEHSVGPFSNEKIPANMLQSKRKSVSCEVAEELKLMNKWEDSWPKGASIPANMLQSKEKSVSCEVAEDLKLMNKWEGSSPKGASIPANMLQCKGESVSLEVAEDLKLMKKSQGSSPNGASKSSAEGPPNEYHGDKKVPESCGIKRAALDVAAGVHGDGIRRRMVTITARKVSRLPVEANHKSTLVNLDRPCSMGKEKESVVTMREPFAPKKKSKMKGPAQSKYLPMNVVSTSTSHSKEKLMDEEDASHLEDDEILKAISVHEGKLEMYLNDPSWRHMQHGGQTADARSKVRMICRRFQFICRTLVQAVEQRTLKSRRIDLAADKLIRRLPGFTKHGPIVGKVPGVEIGDEFLYRVELAIVGLHRPYQGGIDRMKNINGMPIAISIVASGGYPDDLSNSGEVIYTGSGGKPAGKKENEDQKLVRGNLALKNCIKTKTPVRVIHGFKGPNREEGSHSKAKEVSIFTYDGLYHVVDCWQEGLPGSRVFKFRLQRLPGQPELPLHVAKGLRMSVARPGLCIADISQGKEKTPICVINNIDNARPASFKYITRIKGSSLTPKRSPRGCDCTDGCSDSARCACVVKNGGEFPFNFNGAVVHAKPLIYECGPSCRCPPSCHNRVSQLGMKIPLEVFRTTKTGWGVRSLRSISSGSFICEYVGELLHSDEANQRMNDEYLFDLGHNYDIWKGMPSILPGLSSSGPRSATMDDEDPRFTIDAAEYGNVGRFINHSCSPNLYAQNILWDHDDKRVPHIMFFAAENISPLQELTYDYNYEIDHVHDMNGEVKVKYCHCGSPQCRNRLY